MARRTFAEIRDAAYARVDAELAAIRPAHREPWNPSGKSPEQLAARQRRTAARRKRNILVGWQERRRLGEST